MFDFPRLPLYEVQTRDAPRATYSRSLHKSSPDVEDERAIEGGAAKSNTKRTVQQSTRLPDFTPARVKFLLR